MKTLGIDIGSSSIKVSIMDVSTGECVVSATLPDTEMDIKSVKYGWAEQDPQIWWHYLCECIKRCGTHVSLREVKAIGITYQMHGLVCIDTNGDLLRDSIIWCDSRAVNIGEKAINEMGKDETLQHLLNSPGNFTASKLRWVKENEPETFNKVYKFFLPGDYIAYLLSGDISTTTSGLSEQILWDFQKNEKADFVAEYYGIDLDKMQQAKPSIGIQCRTNARTERLFGIPEGTPISFRAGDQPTNAFSLNVLEPGEIAATGGTSGVVYGVTDQPKYDSLSRVNTFLHVNHSKDKPSYGVLLCINGTGILNAWTRRNFASELKYDKINDMCAQVPAGSEGVIVLPFGNGAERMLENRYTEAVFSGIDFNHHTLAHVLRAVQEGIAFAFRYGVDIMREVGLEPKVIRAGKANLFLSPVFRETLATLCDARIELYNTDGSLGAARGAALGAGLYATREEAFNSLRKLDTIEPNVQNKQVLEDNYKKWCEELRLNLNK